jgi:predicted RNase H-like HicB family nuclease
MEIPFVNRYTAVVKQDGDWWIGWVQEVSGVNAQEHSREELLSSLKQVLQEALEMNRAEALAAAAGSPYEELALAL